MSVLVNENTKFFFRASPVAKAPFTPSRQLHYGTKVVGGTTPGKGGQTHLDRPVFNTVEEAVRRPARTPQ